MINFKDLLRFLIKDLIRDGWRTIITSLNLLVFICCYFTIAALAQAAFKIGNQPTDRSSLIIISRNVFDLVDSVVSEEEFIPAQELQPEFVKSVSPLVFRIVKADDFIAQLRAAPLEAMQSVHSLQLLEGFWPIKTNEIIIGEGTAALTNWIVGDTVRIYGSDFKISGLVRAPGTKFSAIWMTLETASALFNNPGHYQFAWIQLQPGVDGEVIRENLQNDPRLNNRYDVFFSDNLYQQYTKAIADMKGISLTLVILALTSVILGTYSNVFLILNERSRDITILRAIGFQSSAIRGLIIIRTLLQVTAAFLLSWGISQLILGWFNKVNPLNLHSIPLPVTISGVIFLFGFSLTLVFGWVGVLLSTWHLQKRSVASFIHN